MAGRGRGGGGRGRGRGMSFDPRDMGFGTGEQLPGPVLQPPPSFPPLEFQPASMLSTAEVEYMVALKKDLVVFLKDHLSLSERGELMKSTGSNFESKLLPAELKTKKKVTSGKKRATHSVDSRSKIAKFDLTALDALAKLEEVPEEPEAEKEGEPEEKGEKDDEENTEEDELLEDSDEEMDDGTDYVNNHFDNGEGFDDDDDNGADGPTY